MDIFTFMKTADNGVIVLYNFTRPILVIDVETPNKRNNRICAIGTVKLCKGEQPKIFYTLVNPECSFDEQNISIHGITPADVADAPTWKEVWNTLSADFNDCIISAHNAPFDLQVINKASRAYDISLPKIDYLCTLKIARNVFCDIPSYKLSTLADLCNIELKHHNACSDSLAAAELLKIFIDSDIELEPYISHYAVCDSPHYHIDLSDDNKAIKELFEIIESFNHRDTRKEDIQHLALWLRRHDHLSGQYPFDDIFASVNDAIIEGITDKNEIKNLLSVFNELFDPVNAKQFNGKLEMLGKTFCLTGNFDFGTRSDVENFLSSLGGICSKTINKKTDLLIVGNNGSSDWCLENYGTKVKHALELQKQGINITIIRESEFFASLEESYATNKI